MIGLFGGYEDDDEIEQKKQNCSHYSCTWHSMTSSGSDYVKVRGTCYECDAEVEGTFHHSRTERRSGGGGWF